MLRNVVDTILRAYARGEIRRGNAKTCVVGAILRDRLGHADTRWWETMIAYAQGEDTEEDRLYAAYLEQTTGFSIWDLWQIDGAFEGALYDPQRSRQPRDEDLSVRIGRVLDLLPKILAEKEAPVF